MTKERVRFCPACGQTILYCDGEPAPAILYRHGTVMSLSNETGRGVPIGCERCTFEPAKKTPRADRLPRSDPSGLSMASPQGRLPQRCAQHEGSRSSPTSRALAGMGHATREVKEIIEKDVAGVVELFTEGREVYSRAKAFVDRLLPKP